MSLRNAWHRLTGGNATPDTASVGDNSGPSGSWLLESADKVVCLLKHLAEEHQMVRVIVAGEAGAATYNSTILKADSNKGLFYLDELSPAKHHEHLLATRKCRIETLFHGAEVAFHAEMQGTGEKDGIMFYGMRIPPRVRYVQRRTAYRAYIPMSNEVPVQLFVPGQAIVIGKLRDVSLGGVSIELDSTPMDLLSVGDEIPTCNLVLPTGKRVKSPLVVRFYGRSKNGRCMRLGAQFKKLPNESRRAIAQVVMQLDRKVRRYQVD